MTSRVSAGLTCSSPCVTSTCGFASTSATRRSSAAGCPACTAAAPASASAPEPLRPPQPPLPPGGGPAGGGPAGGGPARAAAVFLQLGDKTVCVTEPEQPWDDLGTWTSLVGPSLVSTATDDTVCFMIEASGRRVSSSSLQVLKWSDHCTPLARGPGRPLRLLAQATIDDFTLLGVAFIEERLLLDGGLAPHCILPVLLQPSSINQLLDRHRPQVPQTVLSLFLDASRTSVDHQLSADLHQLSADLHQLSADLHQLPADLHQSVDLHQLPADLQLSADLHQLPADLQLSVDLQHLQGRKGSLLLVPGGLRRLEERRSSEPLHCTQDPDRDRDPDPEPGGPSSETHHHMEGHGHHHLHLSSCHECLELENSTILSVKYASAENISDFPDDGSVGLEELEHDAGDFPGQTGGPDRPGKPPNVLVFTGDRPEHFDAVRRLLSECVNPEQNVIYQLQTQQALNEPWLENTRLLVLAEREPLSPQLQTRFLTFLSLGGKVLGLASGLCPAGLGLEPRAGRSMKVSRLSFTREDSSEVELNALASGRAYVRDAQGGGEVELWGELRGDDAPPHQRDMVIVRVTHGGDGGEAVLCQVHFEISADSQVLPPADFDKLKLSNALRYEVLTEILTSLGLSCEPSPPPAPGPVHLLATSQESLISVVTWLKTRSGAGGVLDLSRTRLRMWSGSETQDVPVSSPDLLPLFTESPSPGLFDMETYGRNLKTKLLGHVVLHAEVATSTMDLLDGLSLFLPNDVSLVAVADRQVQGRGRGRNAWLSPLGSATFTVTVQVELGSRLGQRIPFVQHLAALAVVEAVRTLPGYQDLDLRVKWPNDVYYSNLVKVGGVLVTSTVVGSTFHLLIGCGVNVSNSNPTMCINDLILQHNKQHGCSLPPLGVPLLISRSLGVLEALILSFQQGGADAVLPLYYQRWLHSGAQVRLWSDDGLEAEVVGLDHSGFLQVASRGQQVVTVQPDGNSFDMLRNLLVVKHRT